MDEMRRARRLVVWVSCGLVCLAAGFEGPITLKASKVLSADAVRGPHHTLAEDVEVEGGYQLFRVESEYGVIPAAGRTVLRTRLRELDALDQLSEVSQGEVFVGAAGGAVLSIGKGLAHVAVDPVGTVKGIGGGLKRFGVNLGRKAKRTAESVTADDKKGEEAQKSGEQKVVDAAGSVLGVGSSARKWARKLGVDPYTTNPVLHQALVDVGRIDKAGQIVTRVVVPIPTVVTTTASVGDLVWSADPEALLKRNEQSVASLGVAGDVADRFFRNRSYTLTGQTRLIEALAAVKAPGCADYVDAAAEAASEREALFFVESAEMLAGLHKASPVAAILPDSRAMVARSGGAAVALLPFDTLSWTSRVSAAATEIAARGREELGATALEVRLSGTATAAAKAGLGTAGWQVKEGVVDGLTVPPVR
jgi:hypothetical protein